MPFSYRILDSRFQDQITAFVDHACNMHDIPINLRVICVQYNDTLLCKPAFVLFKPRMKYGVMAVLFSPVRHDDYGNYVHNIR